MSMTVWSRVGLLTLVLGMSLLVSAALAQKGELFADFPEYIPATETRYEGTVVMVMSERYWPESWRRMNPALSGDEAPKLRLMRMLVHASAPRNGQRRRRCARGADVISRCL